MTPTDEQLRALEAFQTGEDLTIEACAGSGKTTTLKMLAGSTTRRGLYLAFNRAIADEAKQDFPKSVDCRTGHSLAWGFGRGFQRDRRLKPRVSPRSVLERIGAPQGVGAADPHRVVAALLKGVERFAQSSDPRPVLAHLGALDPERGDEDRALLSHGERWLAALWEGMIDPDSDLDVTHDVYLKLWALSGPPCPAEYVLFDEAQDANPVILGVVRLWGERDGAQIVAVGDRHQQIYSWRGATNAMERFGTARTVRLTQSFRYGDAIASAARRVLANLKGADVPIRGTGTGSVVVTDFADRKRELPDAILARTNAAAIWEVVDLDARGVRVEVAGGAAELIRLLRGVRDLMGGRPTKVAELAPFSGWPEVVEESEREGGEDLRVLVRLVEEHHVSALIATLERTEATSDPQVTVSTAHRSKGLEWGHVRLAHDFRVPDEGEDGKVRVDDELAHLLYVAATRAKHTLDIAECPLALHALEDHGPGQADGHLGDHPGTGSLGDLPAQLLARLASLASARGVSPASLLSSVLDDLEGPGVRGLSASG